VLPLCEFAGELLDQVLHCNNAKGTLAAGIFGDNQDNLVVLPLHSVHSVNHGGCRGESGDRLEKVAQILKFLTASQDFINVHKAGDIVAAVLIDGQAGVGAAAKQRQNLCSVTADFKHLGFGDGCHDRGDGDIRDVYEAIHDVVLDGTQDSFIAGFANYLSHTA